MVLIGLQVSEDVKKDLTKKAKAANQNLSEYLRRLIDQDLGICRDGGQYMTRSEVEEMINLKLKSITETTGFNVAKESFKPAIKEELKEEPATEDIELKSDILDEKIQTGLLYLAFAFEEGETPTTEDVYKIVHLAETDKNMFGKTLGSYGVKTFATTRRGEGVRVYRLDLKEKVERLLSPENKKTLEKYRKGELKY